MAILIKYIVIARCKNLRLLDMLLCCYYKAITVSWVLNNIQCALDIPAPSGMRNCAGISRVPVYRSSRK